MSRKTVAVSVAALLLLGAVLAPVAPARAADAVPKEPQKEPQTLHMTIRAAKPPMPALKYRMLVPAVDRVPGNAAPLYLIALGAWPDGKQNFGEQLLTAEQARQWGFNEGEEVTWADVMLKTPLAKLKSPELDRVLQPLSGAHAMLELASRRERCDWELPLREQGFGTLLPHLNPMRNVASVVCVKARSELARGDFGAALAALRLNFALARNLSHDAVLIQQLVGASIATQTLQVLQEAVGLPNCPNLYWMLADLPTPMMDLHGSLEMERAAIYWTLPELQKVRQGTFVEEDWRNLVGRLRTLTLQPAPKPTMQEQIEAIGMAMFVYPEARQYLLDHGNTPEQLDKLPKLLVIARYFVESYEEGYDNIVKWASVPYWQSRRGMKGGEADLAVRLAKRSSNPLLKVIPSVQRAAFALHRLDRLLAAHQTVEGLRAYAAANNGKLPASLDDLVDTPAPPDPMTGKPLVYKVDGATATLESLDPDQPADGLVVKVTLVQ